jgi:hypothetical protein
VPKITPVTSTPGYARADYFTVTGVNVTAYQVAFGSSPLDPNGAFGPQIAGTTLNSGRRLVNVADGSSNTILISECSGRPWPFVSGGRQLLSTADPSYLVTPAGLFPASPVTDGGGAITWAGVSHGAWAHNNTYNVNTFNAAGNIGSIGPCAVNCSNFRGIYSFHAQGAFAAFGDGSVRLLSTGISAQILMALATANGGETVNLSEIN